MTEGVRTLLFNPKKLRFPTVIAEPRQACAAKKLSLPITQSWSIFTFELTKLHVPNTTLFFIVALAKTIVP